MQYTATVVGQAYISASATVLDECRNTGLHCLGVAAQLTVCCVCASGSPEGLTLLEAEHTLALLNEYLVQVAAPMAMPAGFQVCVPLSSHDVCGESDGRKRRCHGCLHQHTCCALARLRQLSVTRIK